VSLAYDFSSHHPISKLKNVPMLDSGFEHSGHSINGNGMPFGRDPKSGIKRFTQKFYTNEKKLN
jgi:hypothetical protein